jgi:protein-L-isoaspartate(D-aspartate) O-methyltransferase
MPRSRVPVIGRLLACIPAIVFLASPASTGEDGEYGAQRRKLRAEIEQNAAETADSTGRPRFSARVMDAIDSVPRHRFVPASEIRNAYANRPLPIGHGQTISQPYIVALMTELLEPKPGDVVLEVGTGSGYQAAVLSRLAREVVTIERYRTLAETARQRLWTLGYDNVDVRVGDGLAGVPDRAPYDRIIVTAAAETIPDALLGELADGGVMVLPLGPHAGPQQLVKLTKGEQGIKQEALIGVRFVPLLPGTAREL